MRYPDAIHREFVLPIIVRPARLEDAAEMAALLNAVIARGGTTAYEEPFQPERIAELYLSEPAAICCFVAIDEATGVIEGFQVLGRYSVLPDDIGDIGTFARVGGTQRGVGTALFAATCEAARRRGLAGINATIRADNSGGLAFYSRMGFVDHHVDAAVPLKDGAPVDRISKRLAL